jgi:hypothetical protein
MSDPGPALRILLDAVRDGLAKPEVRAALGDLGRWLVELSEGGMTPRAGAAPEAAATPPPAAATSPSAPSSQVEARPIAKSPPITGPAVPAELKIGDSNRLEVVTRGAGIVSARELAPQLFAPPPVARRQDESDLPDLRRVAQSARLKAEACARAARGEPVGAVRDQILAARQGEADFDGGLWMCGWLDAEGRERAARAAPCYLALAAAADFGSMLRDRDLLHPGAGLEEPFQLMAQAQSMVRNFVEDGRGDDLDQLDMFHWLRTLTSEHRCRVLVGRYMRRGDLAAPDDAPTVLAALTSLHEAWKLRLEGAKERRRLIGKVRHKAGLLSSAGRAEAITLWQDLDRILTELQALGVRSTESELTQALAAAPAPPEGVSISEALAEAVRRARQATERDDHAADADEADGAPPSPDVEEAARLLRGRVMLLIGGEVKPKRREAIERAFGLRELRWIPANMNDSSTGDFEPQVRRPETALVVRMVRFTRTNHGELLDLCKRYHRAFVNLPAGYGVNQLAAEILSQAGEQLRAMPPAGLAAAPT